MVLFVDNNFLFNETIEYLHIQADALIALPGGYGTFEELLEMITW